MSTDSPPQPRPAQPGSRECRGDRRHTCVENRGIGNRKKPPQHGTGQVPEVSLLLLGLLLFLLFSFRCLGFKN